MLPPESRVCIRGDFKKRVAVLTIEAFWLLRDPNCLPQTRPFYSPVRLGGRQDLFADMQCKAAIPVQNQSRVASYLGPSSGLENVEFNRRFLRSSSLIQHCHPEVMFSSSIVSPVTYLSIRLRQAQCQLPSYFIGTDTGTPMASSCPSSPATLVLWKTRRSFLWSGLHGREALVKRRHGRGHATTGRPCQKCFSQPRSTPCRNTACKYICSHQAGDSRASSGNCP